MAPDTRMIPPQRGHEPLGRPDCMRPERGPSATAYYRAKHARGERGRYWLHHTATSMQRRDR